MSMSETVPSPSPDAGEPRLDRFLRSGVEESSPGAVVRDARGRLLVAAEDAVDLAAVQASGVSLRRLARRIRVRDGGAETAWLVPAELAGLTREEATLAAEVALPFGRTTSERGLWVRYAPGLELLGVNDRGDVLLARRPELEDEADAKTEPDDGPVDRSVWTTTSGLPERTIVTGRIEELERYRAEAEAWISALEVATGEGCREVSRLAAGVELTVSVNGRVPAGARGRPAHVERSVRASWPDADDLEAIALRDEILARHAAAGVRVPRIVVTTLLGVPEDADAFEAFADRLREHGADPGGLGLPESITASRFFDAETGRLVPVSVRHVGSDEAPEAIHVVAVGADDHDVVRGRGVLGALSTILPRIGGLLVRAASLVVGEGDAVTLVAGPAGPARAAVVTSARLVAQAGASAVLPSDGAGGGYVAWPTERTVYESAAAFAPLAEALASSAPPVVENPAADLGASGAPDRIGLVTHRFGRERVLLDPTAGVLRWDGCPRPVGALVLIRPGDGPFALRRPPPDELVGVVLRGETPEGTFDVLSDPDAPVAAALAERGITGGALVDALAAARGGSPEALAGGDDSLGAALLRILEARIALWRRLVETVPTFLLTGAVGPDEAVAAVRLVSGRPDAIELGGTIDRDALRAAAADGEETRSEPRPGGLETINEGQSPRSNSVEG